MARERMEQSRENYESLASGVENHEHLEKKDPRELGVDGWIIWLDRKILKLSGLDKQAEKKLQQYMKEGRAEATALNEEYEHLKLEVERARKDLDDAKAIPYYAYQSEESRRALRRKIEAEIEDAIRRMEEFKTSKLGMKAEGEPEEEKP